jgi:hypothetical protein
MEMENYSLILYGKLKLLNRQNRHYYLYISQLFCNSLSSWKRWLWRSLESRTPKNKTNFRNERNAKGPSHGQAKRQLCNERTKTTRATKTPVSSQHAIRFLRSRSLVSCAWLYAWRRFKISHGQTETLWGRVGTLFHLLNGRWAWVSACKWHNS